MPDADRWAPGSSLAIARQTERVVIVDLDRPERSPSVLEGTAARIWSLAADGIHRKEIRQQVGVDAQIVDEFLTQLEAARLLRPDNV